MWIDTHNHLDDPAFDPDRDAVLARARAAGVARFVLCATAPETWATRVAWGRANGVQVHCGVHPWDADHASDASAEALTRLDVDGIGEIGLDALHAKTPEARARQRDLLRAQLAIARDRDLPVTFHAVRSVPELLHVVRRDGLPRRGGLLHDWSGSPASLTEALALGLGIGIGPQVGHDRARNVRHAAATAPLGALAFETDAPRLRGLHGRRTEPADVVQVAKLVAALRGLPVRTVAEGSGRWPDQPFAFLGTNP